MSKRTAHSIFIFMMLVMISITMSSCRSIFRPRTDARGPCINNSVELLDVQIGDRFFDNVGSGQQTSFVTVPVGYKTHVTWYMQDGHVYREYDLTPDGIFGEHQDLYGTPCDFIAYARGSGTSARSAKPAASPLSAKEAQDAGFYLP